MDAASKDIVVFLEEGAARDERLAYAAALAAHWQAHLIATFVVDQLAWHPHAGFARGAGIEDVLRSFGSHVEAVKSAARMAFDKAMVGAPFTHEWRVSENEEGEALMLHARHAGLAIIAPPSDAAGPVTALGLAERVIFASGRPTLLVPDGWSPDRLPRRIVVGWNGSREAARAVADAMPFLRAAESVNLVVVKEPKISGFLGADPGTDIGRHLARHGVPVHVEQYEGGDAGAILLQRAAALNADLMVLGAYGQSKVSEFLFGGATRTMLGTMPLPVLFSR